MKNLYYLWYIVLFLSGVLLITGFNKEHSKGWADDGDETPFEVANVFAELNHTDGDLGFHALIDGDDWKILEIEDPNERQILKVRLSGRLRRQGLTELFFESAEPNFADLSPEEFFDRFPEGEYEIEGVTLEGDKLESPAKFTHMMPAPAGNIMLNLIIPAAENCDVDPLPVVSPPVTISWDMVMTSHPDIGNPKSDPNIVIVGQQLVLELEREDEGLPPLVFSVDLPPNVTSFEVPESFTALGEEFKFEILVREESGNQTAVESCFELE